MMKKEKKSFPQKLSELDGYTAEERAYIIFNNVINFFISAVIVVALILALYSWYIYQRDLKRAGAGYTGYTMEELGAVGWLTVDHTDIDYPVMQGKTNTEYLNKDPLGRVSISGSIFLDCQNAPDFSDGYSVIYGHHMAEGKMFGALDPFKKFSYLKTHTTGTLKTRTGKNYRMHIFTCITVSGKNQTVFDVHGADKKHALESLFASKNAQKLSYDSSKKMVALSTCQDTETEKRTAVFATLE